MRASVANQLSRGIRFLPTVMLCCCVVRATEAPRMDMLAFTDDPAAIPTDAEARQSVVDTRAEPSVTAPHQPEVPR